ncbi:Ankyrin repeat protein [Rutstroemia sp. NJR-2017a BBW]|nr:Ankyrin repeat protein [Rutstroemia sp. NJR-2017a BBW]
MAEALGVAASVAGLVSLAGTVVRLGFEYFKELKNAPEFIEKLIRETNNLADVLHSLKNVVEILEAKYQPDASVQIHEINACQKTLETVETRLSKFQNMRPLDKIKWSFEKSAVEGLISDIKRHKTAITIAMGAKEMSVLIDLLDGQRNMMKGLAAVQATLQSGQEEWKKIELDSSRRKLLSLFGTLDVRKWQNTNIRLRQPGTGVWFTDGLEFKSWLSTSCSKLWVHGIATLSSLLRDNCNEIKVLLRSKRWRKASGRPAKMVRFIIHASAIFYCDYKDSETHDPRTILGALARQLIVQHEDCFAQLEKFCKAHNMDEHTVGTATVEDIRDLIIELSCNFDSVSIVVDGLDEITKDRADVTELLDSLNKPHGRIRTLLASRKEFDIESELSTYSNISIAAQSADLRLYVRSEIDKRSSKGKLRIQDLALKDHIIKALTEGAAGMFRWVACQIDYLCECSTDDDRRDALRKLPPDLPSSYERILERVNRSTPENQAIVRRALQWIVYSFDSYPDRIYPEDLDDGESLDDGVSLGFGNRRFGTAELLQALSVKPGARVLKKSSMPEADRVLHWCSSLIRQRADGDGFEIAHFTVKEFLLALDPVRKPEFAQYRLSGDHTELSITCMTFLQYAEFDGLPSPAGEFDPENFFGSWNQLVEKYPLVAYSVKHWREHVLQSQWDEVEKATLNFLDQKAPASVWKLEKYHNDLWNGGYHFMKPQNLMTTTDSLLQTLSPLHWASMFALPDACKSIISGKSADVNRQSQAGTPMCCIIKSSTLYLSLLEDADAAERIISRVLTETSEVITLLVAAGAEIEAKIDPNGTRAALILAMECMRSCNSFEGPVLTLLHAGAWLSREHALFVLTDEWFLKNWYDCGLDSTVGKILDWAAETDFGFVSADAFPALFILALNSLEACINSTGDLVSDVRKIVDDDVEEEVRDLFSAFRYENIFPGPDGVALDNFLSEQCESETSESETSESEISESAISKSGISDIERIAKQLSLAVGISSKNIVSSVEPAIVALIDQGRSHLVSFHLHNGVEIDFNWISVGPNGSSILHKFLNRADKSRLEDTMLFDLLLEQGTNFDNVDSDGRHSLEILATPQKLSMFRKLWDTINTREILTRSPDLPLEILRAAGKHGTNAKVLKFTISGLFECNSGYGVTVHKYIVTDWINGFCAETRQYTDESEDSSICEEGSTSEDGSMSEDNLLDKDQGGNTKMHLLSGNHDPLASITLMELIWKDGHGSNIDTLNGMNLTPLAIAVRSKNTVAMELLLHAGANTMQILQNGQTALHLACMFGNDKAVKALLQNGVDVFVKDDLGHTAADAAERNGQIRLVALIQEHTSDYLGAERSLEISGRDLDNQSGADKMIDGDSEVMDWAPEADPTPDAVIPASLDQKRTNTLKLAHRPSKETIRSAEDMGIAEGQMIWEVDRES